MKSIYNLIDGIDKGTNIIRIEGFTKWSKKEQWIAGSEYKRVDGKEIDLDLYNEIYNFNQEETELEKEFPKKIKKEVKIIRNSEMVASSNFNAILENHTVGPIKNTTDNEGTRQRMKNYPCPHTGLQHKNNNLYLYNFPIVKKGYIQCEDPECPHNLVQIYGDTNSICFIQDIEEPQLNSNTKCLIEFNDEKEEKEYDNKKKFNFLMKCEVLDYLFVNLKNILER